MLSLRMHDDVKNVTFCSDQVIAIQNSSHLLHFKTDGSPVTQSNSAVNHLCSQNTRIVSHSEMTSEKKYVILCDANRYFVLKYDADGQAVIARKIDHSKITQKIKDIDLY